MRKRMLRSTAASMARRRRALTCDVGTEAVRSVRVLEWCLRKCARRCAGRLLADLSPRGVTKVCFSAASDHWFRNGGRGFWKHRTQNWSQFRGRQADPVSGPQLGN
jgi:hypothetical protein